MREWSPVTITNIIGHRMEFSDPNEKMPVIESAMYSLSTRVSEACRQMETEGTEERRGEESRGDNQTASLYLALLSNTSRHPT